MVTTQELRDQLSSARASLAAQREAVERAKEQLNTADRSLPKIDRRRLSQGGIEGREQRRNIEQSANDIQAQREKIAQYEEELNNYEQSFTPVEDQIREEESYEQAQKLYFDRVSPDFIEDNQTKKYLQELYLNETQSKEAFAAKVKDFQKQNPTEKLVVDFNKMQVLGVESGALNRSLDVKSYNAEVEKYNEQASYIEAQELPAVTRESKTQLSLILPKEIDTRQSNAYNMPISKVEPASKTSYTELFKKETEGRNYIRGTLAFIGDLGSGLVSKYQQKTGDYYQQEAFRNVPKAAATHGAYATPIVGNLLLIGAGTEQVVNEKGFKMKSLAVAQVALGAFGLKTQLRSLQSVENLEANGLKPITKNAKVRINENPNINIQREARLDNAAQSLRDKIGLTKVDRIVNAKIVEPTKSALNKIDIAVSNVKKSVTMRVKSAVEAIPTFQRPKNPYEVMQVSKFSRKGGFIGTPRNPILPQLKAELKRSTNEAVRAVSATSRNITNKVRGVVYKNIPQQTKRPYGELGRSRNRLLPQLKAEFRKSTGEVISMISLKAKEINDKTQGLVLRNIPTLKANRKLNPLELNKFKKFERSGGYLGIPRSTITQKILNKANKAIDKTSGLILSKTRNINDKIKGKYYETLDPLKTMRSLNERPTGFLGKGENLLTPVYRTGKRITSNAYIKIKSPLNVLTNKVAGRINQAAFKIKVLNRALFPSEMYISRVTAKAAKENKINYEFIKSTGGAQETQRLAIAAANARPKKGFTTLKDIEKVNAAQEGAYSGLGLYEKTESEIAFGQAQKQAQNQQMQLLKSQQLEKRISQVKTNQQTQIDESPKIRPRLKINYLSLNNDESQKTYLNIFEKEKQKTSQSERSKLDEVNLQAPKQKLQQREATNIRLDARESSLEISAVKTNQKQRSQQKSRTTQKKINKTLTFNVEDSLVKRIAQRLEREPELFEVFGKRFGKDVSLGKVRSKEESEKILKGFLKGTLGASGFIKRNGTALNPNELNILKSPEFRKSKINPLRIVQERKYRLTKSDAQVREINYFKKSKRKASSLF